jgi:hypothetical protein
MDTSLKAVIFDEQGRVLLGKNPRREWELLGGRVAIASYLVSLQAGTTTPSPEHSELAFFDADELAGLTLPDGYKASIRRARELL